MHRTISLIFLSLTISAQTVDWTRANECPVGDEQFVAELMETMTIEEKVGQVIMGDLDFVSPSDLKNYPLGGILNGGNTSPRGKLRASPEEWKSLAQEFYEVSTTRGGANIPVLWGTDAVHGHSNVFGATIFPHNVGLGATNNPYLLEKIGAAVAEEVIATGLYWTFAPTVTVPQDYRWGRTYEGYSESPELVSELGKAFIIGMQGQGENFLADDKIIGTAKHFLGDGGTFLGIDRGNTKIDEETLKDIHATSYFSALDACVQTVMASFNSWNGSKVHGDAYLLTEVLKNQMEFDGFVVGDWDGHGAVPGCSNGSCAQSLNAGVDMFMVPEKWKDLYRNTLRQVKSGEISMARLDDAVRRILIVKQRMGMFESREPNKSKFSEVGTKKNRDLARQSVRESLVLIKNNDKVLPIKRDAKILVVGAEADSLKIQSGGWTLDWQGTSNRNSDFPGSISFLQAVEEISKDGNVTFVENLSQIRGDYDIAIVAYGEPPYAEYAGDRRDLNFASTKHLTHLKLLKEANIPTVSLFFTGRPLWMTKEINLSDAFMVAWLPGTESRGMTDVMFAAEDGKVNYDVKGRLPFSWPKTPYQANLNYFDPASDPLFTFGYGLDYENPSNLSQFDEDISISTANSTLELMRGSFRENYLGFIQEGNAPQIQISSTALNTENNYVVVDYRDTEKQDDTLNIVFNESNNQNSFFILSTEILNLIPFSDGYINFKARVNSLDAETKFLMSCGLGCYPIVDLTEFLQPSDSFTDYSIPLKCLAQNEGLDLSKINLPFYLTSQGPIDIDVMTIDISNQKGSLVLSCY